MRMGWTDLYISVVNYDTHLFAIILLKNCKQMRQKDVHQLWPLNSADTKISKHTVYYVASLCSQ